MASNTSWQQNGRALHGCLPSSERATRNTFTRWTGWGARYPGCSDGRPSTAGPGVADMESICALPSAHQPGAKQRGSQGGCGAPAARQRSKNWTGSTVMSIIRRAKPLLFDDPGVQVRYRTGGTVAVYRLAAVPERQADQQDEGHRSSNTQTPPQQCRRCRISAWLGPMAA